MPFLALSSPIYELFDAFPRAYAPYDAEECIKALRLMIETKYVYPMDQIATIFELDPKWPTSIGEERIQNFIDRIAKSSYVYMLAVVRPHPPLTIPS